MGVLLKHTFLSMGAMAFPCQQTNLFIVERVVFPFFEMLEKDGGELSVVVRCFFECETQTNNSLMKRNVLSSCFVLLCEGVLVNHPSAIFVAALPVHVNGPCCGCCAHFARVICFIYFVIQFAGFWCAL